jgi:hypothetical protein
MEFVDPFGWHILDGEGFQRIHKKLSQFESMTWAEILIDGKKLNHLAPVDDLCSEAKKRLTEIGRADVEELVLLRLSGRERIWGKLDQGVMTVIWWDPNHEVCPSLLKHT